MVYSGILSTPTAPVEKFTMTGHLFLSSCITSRNISSLQDGVPSYSRHEYALWRLQIVGSECLLGDFLRSVGDPFALVAVGSYAGQSSAYYDFVWQCHDPASSLYFPFHRGSRFSKKALMPSATSSAIVLIASIDDRYSNAFSYSMSRIV